MSIKNIVPLATLAKQETTQAEKISGFLAANNKKETTQGKKISELLAHRKALIEEQPEDEQKAEVEKDQVDAELSAAGPEEVFSTSAYQDPAAEFSDRIQLAQLGGDIAGAGARAVVGVGAGATGIGTAGAAGAASAGAWVAAGVAAGTDAVGVSAAAFAGIAAVGVGVAASSRGDSPVAIDSTAPDVTELTLSYNYDENQVSGATVATLTGATDNVAVTQYRFVYADNTTTSTTSEDGFFEIDPSGNIKMTAAGFSSIANDYETTANTHSYTIQAGDAADNWSSVATVELNEQNVEPTEGFIIMQFFDDYWDGPSDIFNVWVPSDSNGAFDPATTGDWYYYKNGELISDPTSYPIDYSNGRWQGQIAWSDITTFESGDTLNIVAIVGGVTYETPVFTCI